MGFSPDQQQLLSVGDAIFLWDILGPPERSPPGRQVPALKLRLLAFCYPLPTWSLVASAVLETRLRPPQPTKLVSGPTTGAGFVVISGAGSAISVGGVGPLPFLGFLVQNWGCVAQAGFFCVQAWMQGSWRTRCVGPTGSPGSRCPSHPQHPRSSQASVWGPSRVTTVGQRAPERVSSTSLLQVGEGWGDSRVLPLPLTAPFRLLPRRLLLVG